MSVPALESHDLSVRYRRQPVLYGVDVAVPPGNLIGILGPNGAGKSSFLKAVMGLVPSSAGWVQIFGQPLEKSLSRIGYVPQRESIDWDFPVTVRDVVLMGTYGGLRWYQRPGDAQRKRAMEALEKVGMTPFANRQIGELSGGQQQRVFLARALAQNADLYLMDEPFAGVDAATERAIIELLREMRAEGKTVLVVHHDLQTAPRYFDMLMLLNMRLVAFGKTNDVFTPDLLEKTYGGRLTVLSDVAARAAAQDQEG